MLARGIGAISNERWTTFQDAQDQISQAQEVLKAFVKSPQVCYLLISLYVCMRLMNSKGMGSHGDSSSKGRHNEKV
jgi:hypothetical protein